MKRTLATALLLLSTVVAPLSTFAQTSFPQVSSSQIDSLFTALKPSNAPGGAVLVVRNGRPVFRRGYGVTDLRTLHPIDAHTNFRLASFTKQFTASCIMLLVRDGKLRYDDHLTDFFPEFPAYGKFITVRNLLNHTSGLPDYEDILEKQYPDTRPEQIPQIHDAGVLKLLEQQPAGTFPPGSKWEYSNSGYAVLAMIVEKVSRKNFGDFLRERIFSPLRMTNTIAYEKGKNEVRHRAYGHTKEKDGWHVTDQSPTSAVLGDGGIYSSLEDLAKWDRALREHTLLTPRGDETRADSRAAYRRSGKVPRRHERQLRLRLVPGFLPRSQPHVPRRRHDRLPHNHSAIPRRQTDHHHSVESGRH